MVLFRLSPKPTILDEKKVVNKRARGDLLFPSVWRKFHALIANKAIQVKNRIATRKRRIKRIVFQRVAPLLIGDIIIR